MWAQQVGQANKCQKEKYRRSTPDGRPKYGSRKEGHGVREDSSEKYGSEETAAVHNTDMVRIIL